ncbi:MAG: hypothetical protein ACRDHN_13675 [Thermomicrobiales bacterium]
MTVSGDSQSGVVLSRNELWLLLHALSGATAPGLRWDGNPLEPWELGELQRKLRSALHGEASESSDPSFVAPIDSELGAELLGAGFDRRAMSHAFDLGSLVAACADRGWGVALELPRGGNVRTPSSATVSVHGPDGDLDFSALERPIVAVARAMLAAAATVAGNPELAVQSELNRDIEAGTYEEYSIASASIQRGKEEQTISRMSEQGWELVREEQTDDGSKYIFRKTK